MYLPTSERQIWLLIALLVLSVLYTGVAFAKEYKLGFGEVLSVTVYDEPDLSLDVVRIQKSGEITLPLVGSVKAVGRTVTEIEQDVTAMYRDGYLKEPKITVAIRSYRNFFTNGQLRSPGAYTFVEGLTVRKAISISGGMTDRASHEKILLKKENGISEIKVIDLDQEMGPGDILTVGESLF
ncbi:MAG: polysaccharide export protein [Gammaproteobacteria bacterium]|nr:polysaccharide export protein [Gammaproteobacteria bacterium]